MPDKMIRAIDPLGIVALAKVLVQPGQFECSCELKPVKEDILEVLSNPVFREVVKGLDLTRLKTIEDFLSIADEIRVKMDSSRLPTRSTDKKKP